MSKLAETYAQGFDDLQQRLEGRIEVADIQPPSDQVEPDSVVQNLKTDSFCDISAPAGELTPFIGRVVLWPNRATSEYHPAVITRKAGMTQMSVLGQPFDPEVGLTNGILFSLGLKNDTSNASFGAHTGAGGFEAGHFAPSLIAVTSRDVAEGIINHGDVATHAVGHEEGGVPEKMIASGLLPGVKAIRTVTLDTQNPLPIGLAWHPKLEDDEFGLAPAFYRGSTSAVKLMLGGASKVIGPKLVEKVGEFTDAAVKGAPHHV